MTGLAADDIAFLGSPGVGASSVDQLGPGAGHVWAGTSEHDPVVQATSGSWFTSDGSGVGPYDESFGANQFAVPDQSGPVPAGRDGGVGLAASGVDPELDVVCAFVCR